MTVLLNQHVNVGPNCLRVLHPPLCNRPPSNWRNHPRPIPKPWKTVDGLLFSASQRGAIVCAGAKPGLDNREVLIGDCVAIVCFCLYKQIASLVQLPEFPGWTAPLDFDPLRFEEFFSFTLTLAGTWVGTSWLVGNYQANATSNVPTALARTSFAWLIAMPIVACQLVLSSAVEAQSLVGTDRFGTILPLAASGPGEPFVSASGVLGTMVVWRSFYTIYLDYSSLVTLEGARKDRDQEAKDFQQAIMILSMICASSWASLEILQAIIADDGIGGL